MKITDNRNKNLVCFKDVSVGNICIWDNVLYMKTLLTDNGKSKHNVVCLTSGFKAFVDPDSTVELINDWELILKS